MTGKVAIVTGAGQGIGKAIALALHKRGAAAAIVDINHCNAEKTAGEIVHAGGKAVAIRADVSIVEDIRGMVEKTVREFGSVDILVNNAGILSKTPVEEITEAEWDRIMNVNLKGVLFATQQVLPYMKQKGFGRIINLSSVAGRMGGYADVPAYAASKAGIIGLTRAVARRVAEYGITVNAVAPGTTETGIIKQLSSNDIEMLKQQIPMRKLGRPENIADTVSFLASEEAEFITGVVLDVNGGIYMG